MPRNLFMNHPEDPDEVPEGEDSPQPEIPEENLGGLFEEPSTVEEKQEQIRLLNKERRELLRNLRGNEGFTTTEQHLERLRDPSRWERG